jgi:hypothetical protein
MAASWPTVGKVVGEAQLGGCAKEKWDGESHGHLNELDLCRRLLRRI